MKLKTLILTLPLLAFACASQPSSDATKDKEVASKSCLKDTGSRIRRAGDDCAGRGQVVDREDIDMSGSADTADVIKRNVPSAN